MCHVRSKTSQRGCKSNDAVFELLPLSLVGSCPRVGRLEGLLEFTSLPLKRGELCLISLYMYVWNLMQFVHV